MIKNLKRNALVATLTAAAMSLSLATPSLAAGAQPVTSATATVANVSNTDLPVKAEATGQVAKTVKSVNPTEPTTPTKPKTSRFKKIMKVIGVVGAGLVKLHTIVELIRSFKKP